MTRNDIEILRRKAQQSSRSKHVIIHEITSQDFVFLYSETLRNKGDEAFLIYRTLVFGFF